MQTLRFAAFTLTLAMLAGCGGQIGSTGAVPQAASQARAHRAKSDDLLYLSLGSKMYVFKYPSLDKVTIFKAPTWVGFHGASNPSNGDMCFDNYFTVYLYKHGQTAPYASLVPPSDNGSFDCALDPGTNSIAMTITTQDEKQLIEVYSSPSSNPTSYSISQLRYLEYAGYDGAGNLFVDGETGSGYGLAELPKGGNEFVMLSTGSVVPDGALAWDGQHMTMATFQDIYQFEVSGSSISVIGKTVLKGASVGLPRLAIEGDRLIGAARNRSSHEKHTKWLGIWSYPEGGKPLATMPLVSRHNPIGTVLISVAPSH